MTEDAKENIMTKLEKSIENFLQGTANNQEHNVMELLAKIIVVEKETATATILFNMLKENYFQSDSATVNFVNKLYEFDKEILDVYMNIYLEQLYSGETNNEEITKDLKEMLQLLNQIDPNLCKILEQKNQSYKEHSQL